MGSIGDTLDAAVGLGGIPGAVVAATSKNGKFRYAKSCGSRSFKHDDVSPPMELNTPFWMVSCTKLVTAIAALQCCEAGLFGLDEDVTRFLPELVDIEVMYPPEEEGGPPILEPARNTITLRHLLLDTSGLTYARFGDLSLPFLDRCLAPLAFEPGEGFIYGTGTDFAGFMVERATKMRLERYIQRRIAKPLGLKSICFQPDKIPGMEKSLVEISLRSTKDNRPTFEPMSDIWPTTITEDSGGCGAYATIPEYQRILHSITRDDQRLLSNNSVEELFLPDMNPCSRHVLMNALQHESTDSVFGGMLKGIEVAYAIGGVAVLEDLPGGISKGTLFWGGPLNVFYWMDGQGGMSGIFGSQVFPGADSKCLGLFAEFERQVYEMDKNLSKRGPFVS